MRAGTAVFDRRHALYAIYKPQHRCSGLQTGDTCARAPPLAPQTSKSAPPLCPPNAGTQLPRTAWRMAQGPRSTSNAKGKMSGNAAHS